MKQLIIVLSGKKQSGKSSTCNYIAAKYLNEVHPDLYYYHVDDLGNLCFGIHRIALETAFLEVVREEPSAKLYSFADPLKEFCVNVMGASEAHCYGSDAEKDSAIPHLLWENVPAETNPEGKKGAMSGRDLMQWFGTDVCRRVYHDIWAQATYTKIKKEGKRLALITDGRFPNEILLASQNQRPSVIVKTLRLLRVVKEDNHKSETALDDFPQEKYSAVLDNRGMTLKQQCEALDPIIDQWFAEAGITDERSTSAEVSS
jgi:hypothetical protein